MKSWPGYKIMGRHVAREEARLEKDLIESASGERGASGVTRNNQRGRKKTREGAS